jgi:PTS system mannose-specific IID component
MTHTATPTAPTRSLPIATRLSMLLRVFAVQASWNYESLMGNGIALSVEPALRLLPGGRDGDAYRAALARQGTYFNSHPYLAALAVGALARAELDGEPAQKIERFRGAVCGPLGSVGDRLVWAGWLPFCSLLGLFAFGLGLGPIQVLLIFLGAYNAGHVWLRAWALEAGWREGLHLAAALGHPLFRRGPIVIAQATAVLAGVAVPAAVGRIVGYEAAQLAGALAIAVGWTIATALLAQRADGWRTALIGVAAFVAISVLS